MLKIGVLTGLILMVMKLDTSKWQHDIGTGTSNSMVGVNFNFINRRIH